MTIRLLFFLLSNYQNIKYRIGEFKKISDYQISNQDLNLLDYRISDSEKLSVANLWLVVHKYIYRHKYFAIMATVKYKIC
jgi:hypothetical protein